MAPPSKNIVTLKVSPSTLRRLLADGDVKSQSPSTAPPDDSSDMKGSPPAQNTEAASDSNAATPAGDGTPAPSMAPPDSTKKKGVKRSAAAANVTTDGVPKPRGKPGPKKKPRLEDGTIDHAAVRLAAAAKLGPKANQGAINAGLRALDRSGKPCRKWAKGGFALKTFTGVSWDIPRWTAPPKKPDENGDADSNADEESADGSNKENKGTVKDENSASASNAGGDAEMRSIASVHASSPAPAAVAAAS